MARKAPSYRRHQRGQAIVVIHGKTYYLGKHGTALSKERYKDALAQHWNPAGAKPDEWPNVEELMARYLLHAKR